jgi:hypothetical protein
MEINMISIKIFKQGNDILIGACDQELVGKKFVDGKFQIDVNREFYGGKVISIETLIQYLKDATIANLVGKNAVECAIKIGLINPECVLKIKGIPHAQMVRMR